MINNINEDDEVKIIGGGNLTYDEMMRKRQHRLNDETPKSKGKVLVLLLLLLCCVVCTLTYFLWNANRHNLKYDVSRTSEAVVNDLGQYKPEGVPSVSLVKDSVNGVVFKLYTIKNLTMTLETETYPDESDSAIYFISRAMDYRKDSKEMIGEFIVDGKRMGEGRNRLAYMASLPGGLPQIGIGCDDVVPDFVSGRDGSMIRQFALVSAGQICTDQFELKGKVTRAAYMWKEDSPAVVYFMETLTKETLYDFSEAIVDYGFTDAIYITDGVWEHRFYRDETGAARDTTASAEKKSKRQYVVFKMISSR